MRVEVVQLENIRSHIKSTVPFTRGFNCLVGALGCGKTSILYAIDFALFGDPIGRSFEYLLREGAESGKITIQFAQSGKTYKLTRGLRKRGKGISQDFDALRLYEDETVVASLKGDAVAEQLKSITGLDRDLWREIVWVRQEHLKELLDAAPRDRQKRLDELFGLSDYELAWSSMADYQKDYEKERGYLERDPDVTGKDKLAVEYNQVTEEFAMLEMDLLNAVEKLGTEKRVLEEAEAQLKKLEDKKLVVEELRRREARLQENVRNMEDNAASLSQRVEDKRAIVNTLKQRLNSIDVQVKSCKDKLEEANVPPNQPVDSLRSCLMALDDRIGNLKAEQEATSRSFQQDQKRVTQLSTETENRCPLCLQPLNDEYKTGMLQRIQAENTERQKTIGQLQSEIVELQRTRNKASEAFSNLQSLTSKTEDLQTRINDEEKGFADLSKQLVEKQNAGVELRGQFEGLRFEISRFDVSDLESARVRREQTFRRYYLAEADLRTKESRKKDLLKRLDEVKERIDWAQQKLERMQKIGKTIAVIGAIRDAYRSIQPKLRGEFVKVLRNFVQQVLDGLVGEGALLNVAIDDTYTPYIRSESGVEREVANLSGGERTLLAFAYRLGLGQLIMQSRTGHGLSMLLLDEPTESLGREDGSIDRLAEAISRFKAIEQIIAVTHSEAFAEKAEHVLTLEKEAGISKVSIQR